MYNIFVPLNDPPNESINNFKPLNKIKIQNFRSKFHFTLIIFYLNSSINSLLITSVFVYKNLEFFFK